ncbi:MAG: UDP-GlcNAc:undecaprenyl-phosphate GlcNAc-1-phosphate transferase [Olleya marilimosa]|jgi:UDP-GlcNAc:undecaprenyl-phosphate GlcNAc-1-phosphate transferase
MILDNLPSNHEEITAFLNHYKFPVAVCTTLFAICATMVVTPKVVAISKAKNLTASPNDRTSHKGIVPTLGGIGVFTGMILPINVTAILFANYSQLIDLLIFNALILALLLIGIFDDIMKLSAVRKLGYQLVVAAIYVLGANMHIDSFLGLFGMDDIPITYSIIFSVFVIVLLINAYNLVDGIDGLAGVLGVLISGYMSIVFYLTNHFFYSLVCLSLVGALIGFLVFNFSRHRKIFLGDTGSLIVGFLLALEVVTYLSLGARESQLIMFKNAPVIVLALVSYPLFDTLRVFFIRIINKRSPFSPDRNHIHHRLVDLGLKHKYATLIIGLYTIVITGLAILLRDLPINKAFFIILPAGIVLLLFPFILKVKSGKVKWVVPTL